MINTLLNAVGKQNAKKGLAIFSLPICPPPPPPPNDKGSEKKLSRSVGGGGEPGGRVNPNMSIFNFHEIQIRISRKCKSILNRQNCACYLAAVRNLYWNFFPDYPILKKCYQKLVQKFWNPQSKFYNVICKKENEKSCENILLKFFYRTAFGRQLILRIFL